MLIKTFLGLVEMMFGLVNVSFSLHEWQAAKMTSFVPEHYFFSAYSERCHTPLLLHSNRSSFNLVLCLVLQTACKESSVQWPAADGFCYRLINEQVTFFGNWNYGRTVINSVHQKFFFELVDIIFGPVHASFNLTERQDVKLTFFAPFRILISSTLTWP